jgi:superfamily II DNA or RNA helicase
VTLATALNEVLPHSVAFDACVGYFNLRGWRLLRDAIGQIQSVDESRPPVRLLIGMAVRPDDELRQALEDGVPQVDRSLAAKRAELALVGFARQLVWGVPNKSDEAALRKLKEDLENGVLKVKFVAREPLHAKLYVAHLAGGLKGYRAVVGSSNFTSAGLVKQGELSLEETDHELTAELSAWFDERWEDRFSVDVTYELISILENSWVREEQPNPYHVYLRLAYELSRDARDGLHLDIPAEVKKVLLPHQVSAVQVATKILERKGIAVIGDVVGLGKTLTGTAIAATTGESVLIIAPKNLVKMWEEHLHRFSLPGKVMSLSMVMRDLPDLRRFKLVMIDESHNLRNRSRKAWEAIRSYIDLNDSKVVLLTATMFNARHRDIGGQLGLKLAPEQPLGIRPERLIDELGAKEVARKTGGRLDTLAAFDRSEHNDDWQRLLSEYLVRRTRAFLETTYGVKDPVTGEIFLKFSDGTSFRFPKRIPGPIDYDGGPDDPNDRLVTDETFAAIADLSYARYQLGVYLKEDIQASDEAEQELIDDLQTAISAAAGFIRTTALKRLTSSAHAFMLTIKRMIARNAVLDYALANGLPVPLGNFSEKYFDVDAVDVDADQGDGMDDAASPTWGVGWSGTQWSEYARGAHETLLAKKPKGIRWAHTDLFRVDDLRLDLSADSSVLQALVDEYGLWTPEQDSKLRALAEKIESLAPGEKILIFSEYKDTVDYLAEHLPRWTSRPLASASGASADAVKMARRFAPRSNEQIGGLPTGESEIDVLVTTDVLSEGQNLQDAAMVVNWDLPWTIIKMIQRAGRVDRVGQTASTIDVLSFKPHDGVEKIIQLRARLLARLKNSAQILGGNERFFDDDDFLIDVGGMFDGTTQLHEDEGEVDASSYALGIWEAAADYDRRIALDLQEVVYSTKAVSKKASASVITYGRTESGTDILVKTSAAESSFITPMEALIATVSYPREPAASALDEHLTLIQSAAALMTEQARSNTLLLNHGIRKRLYDFLVAQSDRIDIPALTRARLSELVDALTSNPLRESAKSEVNGILKSARVIGDDGGQIERLLAMHDEQALVDVRDMGADRVQIVTSMGFNPVGVVDREGGSW